MAPLSPKSLRTRLVAAAFRAAACISGNKAAARETMPVKQSPRRLLIVKVHGMGDSVLIRALIELLQRIHPEVEIGVMGGPATHELMTTGLRVRSHFYDQKRVPTLSIVSMWRDIRQNRYEAVANFEQGSIAGTAFLASAGIETHVGFVSSNEDPKWWLLSHHVRFRQSDSMWQSFLRLAQLLYPDLPSGPPIIELHSSVESTSWATEWWRSHVGRDDRVAVAMHLGCGRGMDYRRWPLARFLALADRLNSRWQDSAVILTGTALEQGLIREFREGFRGAAIDASDLGSIEKTALILKRCRLLVSNDTGIMHLGAAVGTATVGLFGPNSPVHWAPLGKQATYVRDTSLRCSPCINNYLNHVPAKCTNNIERQCMNDIAVASVESAIERLIGRTASALYA